MLGLELGLGLATSAQEDEAQLAPSSGAIEIEIDVWVSSRRVPARYTVPHNHAGPLTTQDTHGVSIHISGASSLPEQQQLAIRFRLALKRAQNAIASGART